MKNSFLEKNFFQYFFIFIFASHFQCLTLPAVFAAENQKVDAAKELNISIMKLKESAKKVREENKRLASELKGAPNKIKLIKKEIESLREQKAQLMSGISRSDKERQDEQREVSFAKKGMIRLSSELKALEHKENILIKTQEQKQQQIEKIKEEKKFIGNDIIKLKQKIRLLIKEKDIAPLHKEERNLMKRLKEKRAGFHDLEQELALVKKKNFKPRQSIDKLQKEQDLLQQRLAIAQDEHKISTEEEKKIQKDINIFEAEGNGLTSQLREHISALHSRDLELKKILSSAQKKLKDRNVYFEAFQQEENQIKKTLEIIVKEREALSSELLFLENELKEKDMKR